MIGHSSLNSLGTFFEYLTGRLSRVSVMDLVLITGWPIFGLRNLGFRPLRRSHGSFAKKLGGQSTIYFLGELVDRGLRLLSLGALTCDGRFLLRPMTGRGRSV